MDNFIILNINLYVENSIHLGKYYRVCNYYFKSWRRAIIFFILFAFEYKLNSILLFSQLCLNL